MFPIDEIEIMQAIDSGKKKSDNGSVQGRDNPHPMRDTNMTPGVENIGLFHINMGSAADGITPWSYYPARRDRQLRSITKAEYLFAGATYSVQSRIRALSWRVDAPGPITKKRYQTLFGDADLGRGWSEFINKLVADLCTQDNGAFVELIGAGRPDGPLRGPVTKLAHLDSALCWRTHDPEFPVIYTNPYLNTYHKIHHTRIMMMASNPQPDELARGVGFCPASRALRAIQIQRNLSTYKDEKISGRFRRGIIYGNGLTPNQFKKAIKETEQENDSLGFTIFQQMPVILTQQPDMKLDMLDLASIPDGFDWNNDTTIYIYAIALAYGVDAREFWPATVSGATKADAAVQHLKAKGKGIGDIIQTLERGFNWSVLPEGVQFVFDYVDDEQDKAKAELNGVHLDNIERGIRAGLLTPQEGKALAISLGIYDIKVLSDIQTVTAPNVATDSAPMDPNAEVTDAALTVPATNTGANNVYSPLSGSSSQQPNDDADLTALDDDSEVRTKSIEHDEKIRSYRRDKNGRFRGGGGSNSGGFHGGRSSTRNIVKMSTTKSREGKKLVRRYFITMKSGRKREVSKTRFDELSKDFKLTSVAGNTEVYSKGLDVGIRAGDQEYVRDDAGKFSEKPGGGGAKKPRLSDRFKALLELFGRSGSFKDGVFTVNGQTRDRAADIQKFLQTKGYKDAKVVGIKTEKGMEYRIEGAADPKPDKAKTRKPRAKKKPRGEDAVIAQKSLAEIVEDVGFMEKIRRYVRDKNGRFRGGGGSNSGSRSSKPTAKGTISKIAKSLGIKSRIRTLKTYKNSSGMTVGHNFRLRASRNRSLFRKFRDAVKSKFGDAANVVRRGTNDSDTEFDVVINVEAVYGSKGVDVDQKDTPFDLEMLRAEMESYEERLRELMRSIRGRFETASPDTRAAISFLSSEFERLQNEYTRRAAELLLEGSELDDEAQEAIEEAKARNKGFFDDKFTTDLADAVAIAIADGGIPEVTEFINRIGHYGAPFWESIWLGLGSRVRDLEQEYTVRVTRHLDTGAMNCETCPPKAGTYDSFEEMAARGIPGDLTDDCKERCKCWVTYKTEPKRSFKRGR